MSRSALVALALASTGCVVRAVEVAPIHRHSPRGASPLHPVRAQLLDGSIVVFPDGATVAGDSLQGRGMRYDFTLRDSTAITAVPLGSVGGLASYRQTVRVVPTLLLSTLVFLGGSVVITAIAWGEGGWN
jgi:1-acyl-sn-glycerol-3-phosphate acyltransferase